MILKLLKNYTLPIAIFIGVIGYKWFIYLDFLTPYLIFTMLFLTFSKIDYSNLKPSWLHLWLIICQLTLSTAIFYSLRHTNTMLAQGLTICFICPTATAAAVITKKLDGNLEFVASYTLYINLVVSIFIPLFFPLMEPNSEIEITFIGLFIQIFRKVFPLLICPFILAFILRFLPKINKTIVKYSGIAFYIWAISLTIVIAEIAKYFIEESHGGTTTILLIIGALFACLIQFFVGKLIGKKNGETIAAGQSLGQKNTIFAIWLGNIYFNPIVAVGAGAYVIWQNIFNSIQLHFAQKK